MEAVHKSRNRTWIDHEVISVKHFLNEWNSALPVGMHDSNTNDSFLESLIPAEEYSEIEKKCGLATMRCEHQEKVEPANSIIIPHGVNLKTLRYQDEDLNKREMDQRYANAVYHAQKFCNYPPLKILSSLADITSFPHEDVIMPEVVLSVQIFVPERRVESNANVAFLRLPSFVLDQEFLVLGCQFLCELRDKIECVSDKAISGEYSDCPNTISSVTCKDIYKSGFFYINEVFYNDMRDKDCRDYSDVIIKWAAKESRGIGPFQKAIMEKTRFIDLDIQLGYPYVYCHQGECEHLMVFSDLRIFSEQHDVTNRNAYPLYVQVKPSKRLFCMICHDYTSSWIVYDNKRLPENPFFFCKHCFIRFNYDNKDQKIGSFRAYHFPDRSKIY